MSFAGYYVMSSYQQQQQQLRAFIVSEDHMKQAFSLLKALNS
ncbi:hypothetical protein [Serratia proteamaculans]|nr:hypothetical protein [Serratia proteamaculans]MDW5509886.1 hypothetical protein [Serratia proteamaculans]